MTAIERASKPALAPGGKGAGRLSDRRFWIGLAIRLSIPVALILTYIGYPAANENASGACAALAMQAYEIIVPHPTDFGKSASGLVGGSLLEMKMGKDYPDLPPALVCATRYYLNLKKPE